MTADPHGPLGALFSRVGDPACHEAGAGLFRDGAVRILGRDTDRLEAAVKEAQPCRVSLRSSEGRTGYHCTCAVFAEDLFCRHLYAVALAADAAGWPGAGAGGPASRRAGTPGFRGSVRPRRPRPEWRRFLEGVEDAALGLPPEGGGAMVDPGRRQIVYRLDVRESERTDRAQVELLSRLRNQDGSFGAARPLPRAERAALEGYPDEVDRLFAAAVKGVRSLHGSASLAFLTGATSFALPPPLYLALLPALARAGRLWLRRTDDPDELLGEAVGTSDGGPWRFRLTLARPEDAPRLLLDGEFVRGAETMAVAEPLAVLPGGLVFTAESLHRYEDPGDHAWVRTLRHLGPQTVPVEEFNRFLRAIYAAPRWPPLELPPEFGFRELVVKPVPRLVIRRPAPPHESSLRADLSFDYDGVIAPAEPFREGACLPDRRLLVRRDARAEQEAEVRLRALHVVPEPNLLGGGAYSFPGLRQFPSVVRELVLEGWRVEGEGLRYRRPGHWQFQVSSGIDWFGLRGSIDFEGVSLSLPSLLASLRRGENLVVLDDGSLGILPEDWLARWRLLGAGRPTRYGVRFAQNQTFLLDAILGTEPGVTVDEPFRLAREEVRSFECITPLDPEPSFRGVLREYQREGLGWFRFLERFGFGGCLADDMGLGKTVQVLALLDARRGGPTAGTSVAVVPKSLLFNWVSEAARFAPALRVHVHAGSDRSRDPATFAGHDLVLMTYATLRADAVFLRDFRFDYAILDEAQAVKNPDRVSAAAARRLDARNRLALTGTPVENHVGDLVSILDFLNPGMLGRSTVLLSFLSPGGLPDAAARDLLRRLLGPFILRRTKAEVAVDLPERTEQTLFCDLDPSQRKSYDELLDHYRAVLRGGEDFGRRTGTRIFEALLRLRQAACHPGLLDPERRAEGSAKLDTLLPLLGQLAAAGHKILVFSQFTKFLGIVRERIAAAGLRSAYLDGRTEDRAGAVALFRDDPDCPLFLVSLRAGGFGLNLDAADYVFLLDPWWNPAVEAQAIDRAHRIGQTRPVFAFRVVARNTVEEKMLELQAGKRELADGILGGDRGQIRRIAREDLDLLLG
jgi:superfamily II DNA or RNA helicase